MHLPIHRTSAILLVIAVAGTTSAWAQNPTERQPNRPRDNQPRQENQPDRIQDQSREQDQSRHQDQTDRQEGRTTQRHGQMAKTDHCLAQMVAWGNEGEIALGELAQQQSQNASVKEFAKTLVDDHSKFLKELQAAVPGITHTGDHQQRATNERTRQGEAQDRREAAEQVDANSPNRRDGQPNQPRSNENPPARNEGAEAQSAQAGDQQMLQIQEQVARKCLASTEKEFRNLDQDKFDHAYLGQQCMAHMKMIAELEVFQQHASPELAELFRQGVETAREHLQQAKKLKEQLDGRGVASRPTERTTE